MHNGRIIVEKLIEYARAFLHLNSLDTVYIRNLLLKELKIDAPLFERLDTEFIKSLELPDSLIEELTEYVLDKDIIPGAERERFASYIMGLLTPLPSKVNEQFMSLKEMLGEKYACDYLYNLSIKNNYIRKTAIDRNIKWDFSDGNNTVEVTINLSKPEKDNLEIAKALEFKSSGYPQCALCKENEGNYGDETHADRGNLRTVAVKLDGGDWFMQYSPYLYYNEHCIVISKEHRQMVIDDSTFRKLLDFTDFIPDYFIGSNSDLPIVGGSILSHEHYQGGRHEMPMHRSKSLLNFKFPDLPEVEVSIIDWYLSTVRLSGKNRQQLLNAAGRIMNGWKGYSDADSDIIAATDGTPHNTVTPIARKKEGKYILELILRNNRTSDAFPDGIFHAHPDKHNIKKEGIGLIEAMGLFILPPRLKRQTELIENILNGKQENVIGADLSVHREMIACLKEKYPKTLSLENARAAVKEYINNVCKEILFDAAVFKPDEIGRAAFSMFLTALGAEVKR